METGELLASFARKVDIDSWEPEDSGEYIIYFDDIELRFLVRSKSTLIAYTVLGTAPAGADERFQLFEKMLTAATGPQGVGGRGVVSLDSATDELVYYQTLDTSQLTLDDFITGLEAFTYSAEIWKGKMAVHPVESQRPPAFLFP